MKVPQPTGDLAELINRGRNISDGIMLERPDIPKKYYVTKETALTACNELASQNPMCPYSVLEILDIVETGTPTLIRKKFTDEGELIIV